MRNDAYRCRHEPMMRWLKIHGACAYAGDMSSKTIYAAVAAGRLRAARVGAGRNLMFSEEWIDDWLRGSATPANGRSGDEKVGGNGGDATHTS